MLAKRRGRLTQPRSSDTERDLLVNAGGKIRLDQKLSRVNGQHAGRSNFEVLHVEDDGDHCEDALGQNNKSLPVSLPTLLSGKGKRPNVQVQPSSSGSSHGSILAFVEISLSSSLHGPFSPLSYFFATSCFLRASSKTQSSRL